MPTGAAPVLQNHVKLALARLPTQFADSPNIIALVTALMGPIQILETAQYDLLTMRSIATGQGVQLDAIGEIVGQPRQGVTDAVYQQYLAARVLANRSHGTSEELIAIANAVLGAPAGHVWLRGTYDATFTLEVHDWPTTTATADILQEMLTAAVDAGVRIMIVYSEVPLAQTFCFDVGPGFDQGYFAGGIDAASPPP